MSDWLDEVRNLPFIAIICLFRCNRSQQLPSQSTIMSSANSSSIPISQQQQQQQQYMNRPSSAYFNTNNAVANKNTNNLVNSNSNLNNSNTLPSQLPLHYTQMPNAASGGHPANERQMHAFIRDAQLQQSLRMNQMMAPSMPNIAHSSAVHGSNMSSSQSMQNVNMIHPGYYMQPSTGPNYPNGFAMAENQHQHNVGMQHQHQQSMEMARRRNQQRQQEMYSLDVNVQNSMPNLSGGSMLLSPIGNQNDQMNANYRSKHQVIIERLDRIPWVKLIF